MLHQSSPPKKYIVRQHGSEDREFESSQAAVEHLVANPGVAKLFAGEELIMTKGTGFSHFDAE